MYWYLKSYLNVAFAAFDVNCRHGACRTVVLAGSATQTTAFVDGRLAVDHQNSLRGAVACAGSAAYAVVCQHHSMSYANGSFFLFGNGLDSSRRTYLAAAGAGHAAVPLVECNVRLHERREVGRGSQHLFWALTHTELAGGAAALKVL